MQINNTSNSPKLTIKNQPSFGAGFPGSTLCQKIAQKTGESISKGGFLKSLAGKMEAHAHVLSPLSLVALLYGATIIPRYIQAYDKHDKREILLRDTVSITALLYFAESLKRGFSRFCEQRSGFALNFKPTNDKGGKQEYKNIFSKAWGYLNPLKGLSVMNTEQLKAKYSTIENYKDGFEGFANFIKDQGGKLNKVLHYDKEIRGHATAIIGKDVINASHGDIVEGFAKSKNSEALAEFFKALGKNDNALVTKARKMNSYFGFFSTFIAVPAFMVWIQRYNENLTKKIIAKDLAKKQASEASQKTDSKVIGFERVTFEQVSK